MESYRFVGSGKRRKLYRPISFDDICSHTKISKIPFLGEYDQVTRCVPEAG